MTWARVNTSASTLTDTLAASNTKTITTASLTVGNRVFVVVFAAFGLSSGSLSSAPSDGVNTYTLWKSATQSASGITVLVSVYSAPVTTGGVQTISATVSGGANDNVLGLSYAEYSGLDTSAGTGAMDASGSGTFSAATATGTVTSTSTTAANQLVLSAPVNLADNSDTFTWNTGTPTETKIAAMSFDANGITQGAVAEGTMASGTTASANWTISASDTGALAIIVAKLAAAAPTTPLGPPLATRRLGR